MCFNIKGNSIIYIWNYSYFKGILQVFNVEFLKFRILATLNFHPWGTLMQHIDLFINNVGVTYTFQIKYIFLHLTQSYKSKTCWSISFMFGRRMSKLLLSVIPTPGVTFS